MLSTFIVAYLLITVQADLDLMQIGITVDGRPEIIKHEPNMMRAVSGAIPAAQSVLYNAGFQIACYQDWLYTNDTIADIILWYGKYGCWCGLGGSGSTVDEIDSCCKVHDECYGNAAAEHVERRWLVTDGVQLQYSVTCQSKTSICHGAGWGRAICECDKKLASCINQNKEVWYFWYSWPYQRWYYC